MREQEAEMKSGLAGAVAVLAYLTVLPLFFGAISTVVLGAEQQRATPEGLDVVAEAEVFGGNLMSLEERRDLHLKYCTAKKGYERHAVFVDHGRFIHRRAKEKGVELPKDDMVTQSNWIHHVCPDMDALHGKAEDAGHHSLRHDEELAPNAEDPAQAK